MKADIKNSGVVEEVLALKNVADCDRDQMSTSSLICKTITKDSFLIQSLIVMWFVQRAGHSPS